MQPRSGATLLATVFCVALVSPAGAALLTLTGGTLTFKIGPLPPLAFTQNAPSVLVSGASSGGSFVEPAGVFTGTLMLPTSLFTALPRLTIANLSNLTKSIAPGAAGGGHASALVRPGGGMGGPGPLQGDAIINVLSLFNLVIPLEAVGDTGGVAQYAAGSIVVTVLGTGWTTGALTVTGVSTGFPTVVNTVTLDPLGFDNRTAAHNGVIQLVSAFKVVTNFAGNLPGYALQRLTFTGVPEPGTLALLGAGVAALVGYGLRRRRAGP